MSDDVKKAFLDFREATDRFYKKELTVKEYKGISGGYGSYAQKGGECSMIRLRLAGGLITKDKLSFIVDCINKYKIDMVHLTTCQAVQLHNISGEAACDIAEKAMDHGIITLGGGGDNPRNITASPLSGIEKNEYYDVLPYAQAAEDYLMSIRTSIKLPRKLKVGFSNSPENITHATFRDLGFVANLDGTFDVYSAGGLGKDPCMGLCVCKGVSPSQVLYHIRAMVKMFTMYGNYEDRSKARTRYMQETLGVEDYIKKYTEMIYESLSEGGLDLKVEERALIKKGNGVTKGPRIYEQKQSGLYYVVYHPIGGDPKASKFEDIYNVIKDMDDVEIRVSPDETMYIVNCNAKEAEAVFAVTNDGARTLFESSVSCVGNTICQIGLRDSHGLLLSLVKMSRKNDFADGVLPRIHISGCISSCGSHQIGVIGFQGASGRKNGIVVPAFNMFIDGSHFQNRERFGDSVGVFAESDIVDMLEEIGKTVTKSGKDFKSWFTNDRGTFTIIVGKYVLS